MYIYSIYIYIHRERERDPTELSHNHCVADLRVNVYSISTEFHHVASCVSFPFQPSRGEAKHKLRVTSRRQFEMLQQGGIGMIPVDMLCSKPKETETEKFMMKYTPFTRHLYSTLRDHSGSWYRFF